MTDLDQDLRGSILAAVAPGTELRDGLERILRGRTGALIVLGHDKMVDSIATGGFELQVEFSATRLRELAKMDGAIILDRDGSRILRAATQLVPEPSIPTRESGTRHRTADRVARMTGHPVISVSQSMAMVALYVGDKRIVLEETAAIQSRANQALQTLERYKFRLDEVTRVLSFLEIEDLVTVRDIAAVAQRLEMVHRIRTEIAGYVLQLGVDGRLVDLQLAELTAGLGQERDLVVRDYSPTDDEQPPEQTVAEVLDQLANLSGTELLDLTAVASALGLGAGADALERSVSPWGYRLVSRVPRLPAAIVDRVVTYFQGLAHLLAATQEDLLHVEGIGETRAQAIRGALQRMAESARAERFN